MFPSDTFRWGKNYFPRYFVRQRILKITFVYLDSHIPCRCASCCRCFFPRIPFCAHTYCICIRILASSYLLPYFVKTVLKEYYSQIRYRIQFDVQYGIEHGRLTYEEGRGWCLGLHRHTIPSERQKHLRRGIPGGPRSIPSCLSDSRVLPSAF
jgi:hypothetical protein